jgi:CRP-like cAMP-binding protein
LAPATLAQLLPTLAPVALRLKETLITPDAPIRALYFPLDAVVSVVGTLPDGTQLEAGTIGNEGVVGVARFLRTTHMPFTAVAQVPGAALRLDAETFD